MTISFEHPFTLLRTERPQFLKYKALYTVSKVDPIKNLVSDRVCHISPRKEDNHRGPPNPASNNCIASKNAELFSFQGRLSRRDRSSVFYFAVPAAHGGIDITISRPRNCKFVSTQTCITLFKPLQYFCTARILQFFRGFPERHYCQHRTTFFPQSVYAFGKMGLLPDWGHLVLDSNDSKLRNY